MYRSWNQVTFSIRSFLQDRSIFAYIFASWSYVISTNLYDLYTNAKQGESTVIVSDFIYQHWMNIQKKKEAIQSG